jgi:hypothetical protein
MAHLSQEQQQRYKSQYQEIEAMYQATEADATLFPALGLRLDEALSDPACPRGHCFKYHVMNVYCKPDPLPQVEMARKILDEMARALQATGISQEEVDKFFEGRRGTLAAIEGSVKEQQKEREARNGKYAALFYAFDLWCRRLLTMLKGC